MSQSIQTTVQITLRASQRVRLHVLQITGIALLTVGVMNCMFLPQSAFILNGFLLISGFSLLVLSVRLWHYYRRPRVATRRATFQKSDYSTY